MTKKTITDTKKIDEILNRGTIVKVLPSLKDFRKKLLSGQRLTFYIGFDATAPTLHLSHAKNFMLMEKFRQLGHQVIILFGDFTARIGDPSGNSSARKQLTRKEVLKNVSAWKKMVAPLMNFQDPYNPPSIKYNHTWLSKLNFEEIIQLASNFTVQQMIERDMFQKRIKEGKPIFLHEFLYPLMQGFDSVAMNVDVEMCGTDQIFNALAGRTLIKKIKAKEKFVVAVTLMENPKTGELMSKSKGTGVFLNTAPEDLFGQIMAQPDEMLPNLLTHCTHLTKKEINTLLKLPNPRDAKLKLAFEITKIIAGTEMAEKAQNNFKKIFQTKKTPDNIPIIKIQEKTINLAKLLIKIGFAKSNGEVKRLIKQQGIKVNKEIVKENKEMIISSKEIIIQKGKRFFVKVKKI